MPEPPTILFVAETPSDLARVAPLAAALPSAGLGARVHWFGDGPPPPLAGAAPETSRPAASSPGAVALAVEAALAAAEPRAVAVSGDGPAAFAAAAAAAARELDVVRLDAGRRGAGAQTAAARRRRAIDHASTCWFVATETQAAALVREGIPLRDVHVAGSLLPQGRPRAGRAGGARTVLLAVADPGPLAAALADWAGAAGAVLQAARARQLDLDALAAARAVVTDDDVWQEAACLAGVPCVTAACGTAWPETVDCGANQVAGPSADALARALAIAFAAPPWTPPYPQDALGAHVRALASRFARAPAAPAAPRAPAAPAAPLLPSDADCTGRTLGEEECELVSRAIRSGTLNSTRGTFVHRFEREFAAKAGRRFAVACASGSAAVHAAVQALGLSPGDEVITSPITDMGALTCILYEGALPVFADVEPTTLEVTAATIAAQVTARTRAIVVTHLFGRPCDMEPIVALAAARGLPLIEDMAQAFGAEERTGRPGTFGALACYSLQQGKHMTTGEGGVVTTDDPALARAVFLFVNKGWGYGDARPDHYFPALNYRLTELQGAVALAQLRKLDWVIARRREVAARFTAGLAGVPGLVLPADPPGGRHAWWKYPISVDPELVGGGAAELGRRLLARGVACAPRYIQKPAFECRLFLDFAASPVTRLPLSCSDRRHASQPLFHRRDYPGAARGLERILVLPVNELYAPAHVTAVVDALRSEAEVLAHA